MLEQEQEAGKTIQRGRRNRLSMYQKGEKNNENWYMPPPQP